MSASRSEKLTLFDVDVDVDVVDADALPATDMMSRACG